MDQTLKTNKVFEILTDSDKRITVMQGGSRCFTGEVLVHTEFGHKPISKIDIGEKVYCIDNQYKAVLRPVVDKFIYKGDQHRHNVVTFVLSDNKKITCTYDHKLLQRDGYVAAFDIAIGMLGCGSWDKRALPYQQPWSTCNNEIQEQVWRGWGESYETSEGCQWIFEDNDSLERAIQDCEDASVGSGTFYTKRASETSSKPHQQPERRQQSSEFGVGDIQREFGPYDSTGETNFQQWREEWEEYPYFRYCKVDKAGVQTICSDDEGFSGEIWREQGNDKRYIDGQELGQRILEINDVNEILFHTTAESVYDIEVEDFHNYFVTDKNYISHNSGKTYNILIWFIVKLLQENGKTLTIVRQSLPSIKGTVLRDFIDILGRLGIYSEDNHNKTDQIYSLNGNIIEFVSADQPQKIRGRARQYLFCNEANELTYEAWMQLIMRTEGKIVIDYNPSDLSSWIYDSVIPRDDADFHITTFRDNPFLPKELVLELERLKDADPNYWTIYGLGERGLSQDLIYSHWKTTEQMPEEGEVVYGLDFGFNVPSSLIKIVFVENSAYVQELIYEPKLTTADLVEKMKQIGIDRYDEIYCDAAEPKTIEEMIRNGFNAKPANKDVTEGIRTVKATPLIIHESSVNLLKEVKNYRWKTDRNGNKLDAPVKFNDHACFIGETMITTIDGLKRIDKIEEGDLVLTSEGYRKVNKLFDNGLHLVEKYSMQFDTFELTLVCTPNHKVKTNEGWTEISKLQSGMTVYLNNFIEESHLDYNQVNDTLTMDHTRCIGGYGSKRLEANDQKDTTSITLMETLGTTDSKTCNYSNQTNTLAITSKSESRLTESGLLTFKRKASQKLLNGINRLKELNGTKNTQKSITLVNKTMGWETANNVGKNTIEKNHTQNSAILTAKLKHLECEGSWKERVYDLNVDTTHEYFANGLLVHNCDAMRYGIFSKLTIPSVTWGAI